MATLRFGIGKVEMIYSERPEDQVLVDRLKLVDVRRASHVEPIRSGNQRGKWYVDFSPLGPEYQLCLITPFASRDAALAAEVRWLEENYLGASPSS